MEPTLICYSKCTTCKKASAWLRAHGIDAVWREITTERPSLEELGKWLKKSGLPVRKMFNASGLKYKELNLKEKVGSASEAELLELLASDGMLVKRPVLVWEGGVLFGFDEPVWTEKLPELQRE